MKHLKAADSPPSPTAGGRARAIVRALLILFVVAACVTFAAREIASKSAVVPGTVASPSDGNQPSAPGNAAEPVAGSFVMAYYFHTTERCTSCRLIEAWTAETLQTRLKEQLADGSLIWRLVDVQEPANSHFVQDYELVSKSVVLVRYEEGKPGRWENLPQVWELLGDKAAFQDYIEASTNSFIETPR
jgi:hypothetical protein